MILINLFDEILQNLFKTTYATDMNLMMATTKELDNLTQIIFIIGGFILLVFQYCFNNCTLIEFFQY